MQSETHKKGFGFYNKVALIVLYAMFLLLMVSMLFDSAIMDELAHIPAGYSYISQLDYRLNPEHPPLAKALAGLSARIFMNPTFPTNTEHWQTAVNHQWDMGSLFLYQSGNDADQLIFWSRLPLVLMTVLLGVLIYWWTKRRFGPRVALMTLLFYAFSPTFLAHGKYVTTDIAASFGFFIGIISFVEFLERPTWRNTILVGLAFGIAQLLKFSLVLLLPMDILIFIIWILTQPVSAAGRLRLAWQIIVKYFIAMIIALGVISTVYGILIWNYPVDRQITDTQTDLGSYGFRTAVNIDLALMRNPLTRPFGQYMLGVLMVQQRASGGNTAYFLGEVSSSGSRLYFPLLYLLKEPLPLHILTLIAVFFGILRLPAWRRTLKQKTESDAHTLSFFIRTHLPEVSAVVMIVVYWAVSLKSPLNIGIRHVLPTFPFIYLLVARGIDRWLSAPLESNPSTWRAWLHGLRHLTVNTLPKYAIIALLFLWLIAGTVMATPHFLPYYNALGGGTENGYKIAVDSNYDWGQDFKRLQQFVEANHIDKISISYFGAADPKYYLGDKVEYWWAQRGPAHGWFAISSTLRQGSFGTTAPGFVRSPEDGLDWLKPYTPVARAGYSLFIYKLP